MAWKRTIAWSVLIFVAALIVGLALGTGRASTIGVFLSSTTLYYFFFRPLRVARVRHGIAAFLLVEAIDWSIPLMLGAPFSFLLDNWDSSARHLGAATLGCALAWLSSNNSFKGMRSFAARLN